jgi:hypothetical protein
MEDLSVPGSILNTLHVLSHLIFTTTYESGISPLSSLRVENCVQEKFSNFPRAIPH